MQILLFPPAELLHTLNNGMSLERLNDLNRKGKRRIPTLFIYFVFCCFCDVTKSIDIPHGCDNTTIQLFILLSRLFCRDLVFTPIQTCTRFHKATLLAGN